MLATFPSVTFYTTGPRTSLFGQGCRRNAPCSLLLRGYFRPATHFRPDFNGAHSLPLSLSLSFSRSFFLYVSILVVVSGFTTDCGSPSLPPCFPPSLLPSLPALCSLSRRFASLKRPSDGGGRGGRVVRGLRRRRTRCPGINRDERLDLLFDFRSPF